MSDPDDQPERVPITIHLASSDEVIGESEAVWDMRSCTYSISWEWVKEDDEEDGAS